MGSGTEGRNLAGRSLVISLYLRQIHPAPTSLILSHGHSAIAVNHRSPSWLPSILRTNLRGSRQRTQGTRTRSHTTPHSSLNSPHHRQLGDIFLIKRLNPVTHTHISSNSPY